MRWLNALIVAGPLLSATGFVASTEEITVANAPPVVVSTEPRAGQTDVAPGPTEIRVTFSRLMRDGSWSWVKLSDASFPKTTGNPRFSTINAPACCRCRLSRERRMRCG